MMDFGPDIEPTDHSSVEYYVVVTKVGESEGRAIGTYTDTKILRVPAEFAGQGLELRMQKRQAYLVAKNLQKKDDVESAVVKRVTPGTPLAPKEM